MADIIAYIAGFLAMITFVPQVIKTMRTKKADDVSIIMLLLTLITNILYITYGVILDLYPIIVTLGIMSIIVLLQIYLTIKYRTRVAQQTTQQRLS